MFRGAELPQRNIEAAIDINASAERVWQILLDFARYPEWNPLIRSMTGPAKVGARLRARVQAPGRRAMTVHPSVITCGPDGPARELRLLISHGSRSLFEADHRFVIQPVDAGAARFIQSERFTGLLTPLFRRLIDVDTKRGFEAMNRALKQRAEGLGDDPSVVALRK